MEWMPVGWMRVECPRCGMDYEIRDLNGDIAVDASIWVKRVYRVDNIECPICHEEYGVEELIDL